MSNICLYFFLHYLKEVNAIYAPTDFTGLALRIPVSKLIRGAKHIISFAPSKMSSYVKFP